MYNCQDSMDQWFRYYENGELVNEKSRQCLDVDGVHGSGNIAVNPCEDKADQMWNRPRSLCNGEYCAFMNKKSSKCLDVDGNDGRGGVATHNCDGQADQRLKFVTDKWTAPISKWVLVGCNQNGQVSQQISNTVEYSTEITASITIEVSSTIEANLSLAPQLLPRQFQRLCQTHGQAVSRAHRALHSRAIITTTRKHLQEAACGSWRSTSINRAEARN
eukprot:gene13686-biopygen10983